MNIKLKGILFCMVFAMLVIGLTSCEQEGTMEKSGKAVDEAVEETEDALKDAKEKMEDAVEDAKK